MVDNQVLFLDQGDSYIHVYFRVNIKVFLKKTKDE